MVWLACSKCSNRVGVLAGSVAWCWGRGHSHDRCLMRQEVTL